MLSYDQIIDVFLIFKHQHVFMLSRFSSDLYTIDDSLPFILNILLANFVGLLGIAIVLLYVQVATKFFTLVLFAV